MKLKLESEKGLMCDASQKPLQFSILIFCPAFQGGGKKLNQKTAQAKPPRTNQKQKTKTNKPRPTKTQANPEYWVTKFI